MVNCCSWQFKITCTFCTTIHLLHSFHHHVFYFSSLAGTWTEHGQFRRYRQYPSRSFLWILDEVSELFKWSITWTSHCKLIVVQLLDSYCSRSVLQSWAWILTGNISSVNKTLLESATLLPTFCNIAQGRCNKLARPPDCVWNYIDSLQCQLVGSWHNWPMMSSTSQADLFNEALIYPSRMFVDVQELRLKLQPCQWPVCCHV